MDSKELILRYCTDVPVEKMEQQLVKSGWKHERSTYWSAPNNLWYNGPAFAYALMKADKDKNSEYKGFLKRTKWIKKTI